MSEVGRFVSNLPFPAIWFSTAREEVESESIVCAKALKATVAIKAAQVKSLKAWGISRGILLASI
jgi:hypothetical protein